MAQATIAREFRFEAAHHLPHHDGKCARLHGHSYRVEVRVHGHINGDTGLPDEGMVLDFARLSEAWAPIHHQLDHQCLNDVLGIVTTAENLAVWILAQLRAHVPDVCAVRVYETASSWAEVAL